MLKFVAVLLLATTVLSENVNVRPCAGGLNPPTFVESAWCTTERCTVTRNQSFQARVGVTSPESFSVLTISLKATLVGIPFPINVPEGFENACNFLEGGKTCPTTPNAQYVWNAVVPVDQSYPAASGIDLESKFTKFLKFLSIHFCFRSSCW